MNKTTEQILAESRSLRLAFKPTVPVANYEPLLGVSSIPALPWEYMHYQILVEPNFQWQDVIVHKYITEGPVGDIVVPEGITVIIHGHSRAQRCYSKYRCQSLGYKGEE